ncbi:MAG TPA: RNA polymerase subunit sigma-24 [Lentisphaeria bacterium]|nr:RNA polymerase subunit sigma-24 [Lentisphaeria bacterium]
MPNALFNMENDPKRELSDSELIDSFLKDELSAFEALYERYRKQLYSYLHRLLPGQHALVDEIFQQTWIRVINQLSGYRHNQKFLAWVIRISHNLAIDHFRRNRREETNDFEGDRNILFSEEKYEPWRKIDREELSAALEKCIQKLPDEQREVFLLRQEDVGFKEIAKIQDCSINTVLGRMQYAIRNLQKQLSEWNFKKG